jgi:hypothetical protein
MINAARRSGIIFQQCGEGRVNHKPSTVTFRRLAGCGSMTVTACGGEAVLRSGARRYSAAIVMEPIEHSDRKPDMNKRYDF